MKKFTVKIADRIICVNAIFDSTEKYCKDYLCDGKAEISVEITSADIEFERRQAIKADEKEGGGVRVHTDPNLEIIAVQRKITEEFFKFDTVLFHGSVIAVGDTAYMFTATSGTGKSTHTRLWREMLGDRAVMVNDDKPFVSLRDGEVVVHGSPWNGKHRLGSNVSFSLGAICILERGEVNEIKQISPSAALRMLFQQSSRPRTPELMGKYMELIDGVAKGVRFYALSCNMKPEAARVAFEAMSSKGEVKDKEGFYEA